MIKQAGDFDPGNTGDGEKNQQPRIISNIFINETTGYKRQKPFL